MIYEAVLNVDHLVYYTELLFYEKDNEDLVNPALSKQENLMYYGSKFFNLKTPFYFYHVYYLF